ncbi:MAG: exodeoxyribonuclease VII small subunit [Betaproteobacteria bacterium HGW-Betaproteobacteria-22]|nr:MAG: exodeoxyribonuclease VII small subunit [Betaproteobacteria bacterium HGW-Betaproteobacteria-22]
MSASTPTKNSAPPTPSDSMPVADMSFEQAFGELEKIVAQMESSQMPLEASLAAYQRGSTLLAFCQKSLADVEQQVSLLNDRQQLVPYNAEIE